MRKIQNQRFSQLIAKAMLSLSIATASFGLLATTACGEDPPPPKKEEKKDDKKKKNNKKDAKKEEEQPEVDPNAPPSAAALALDSSIAYSYDPREKRDPFTTYFSEVRAGLEEQQEPATDLEKFDIDKLKLIGIISGTTTPMAMILAPDGKGYPVKVGTPIGKHSGKVRLISNKGRKIEIQEEYRDFNGRKITNQQVLELPVPLNVEVEETTDTVLVTPQQ